MTGDLKVLIVGGGVGGMSAAIVLRRLGAGVDLIDLDPHWRVYGAGITVTSPTWRAFDQLGLLPQVLEHGFSGRGIRVCDVHGRALGEVADPPGMPGSGGIMRPALHGILSRATLESGARVSLGVTVDELVAEDNQVVARLSDGQCRRFDLVVGADGLFSKVRSLVLPDAPQPDYTGQTVWRLIADRPAAIDRRHFFLGGRAKVGLSPVSRDKLYMFLLEAGPRRAPIADASLGEVLDGLLDGYEGVVAELRGSLKPDSPIVVRPLEAFLLPPPWYIGRTLLIGDAAHPTTPQLASGAGMAVEDALVLGEELARSNEVPEALERFSERRSMRCLMVVENSLEIGRLEREQAPPAEQTRLVADTLRILAEPI